MTSQTLYEILEFLDVLDRRLGLEPKLESIRDSLVNIVNSPATPQYQSALASALAEFENARARLSSLLRMTFSTAGCALLGSLIRMAIPSNLFNGDTKTATGRSWRYKPSREFDEMRGVKMKIKSMGLALVLFVSLQVTAQSAKAGYPSMAPLDQYLMERDAEISLARRAAPESISGNAEILILTRRGFETVVKGTNGFVCMVARSWSAYIEDPDFWNPRLRVPICYNVVAARSQVPVTIKRTEVVLAGGSKAQVFDAIKAAIESKGLPTAEPGAMAYMLSRQTYKTNISERS